MCRVARARGRPRRRQRSDGLVRVEAYLSPLESRALAAIAAAEKLPVSRCIRALIRMAEPATAVDS